MAVRWYLMFPISYRDLGLLLQDRAISADRTTIFRWIQIHAAELEKPIRPNVRMSKSSWPLDATYILSANSLIRVRQPGFGRSEVIFGSLSSRRRCCAAGPRVPAGKASTAGHAGEGIATCPASLPNPVAGR